MRRVVYRSAKTAAPKFTSVQGLIESVSGQTGSGSELGSQTNGTKTMMFHPKKKKKNKLSFLPKVFQTMALTFFIPSLITRKLHFRAKDKALKSFFKGMKTVTMAKTFVNLK